MDDAKKKIKEIKENGYCILNNQFSEVDCNSIIDKIEIEYKKQIKTLSDNTNQLIKLGKSVLNLQNKDSFYIRLFSSEIIEKILINFLNDIWYKEIDQNKPNYIMRSLGARSSINEMFLHIDSYIPYIGNHSISMVCSIILEDQFEHNGGLVVVPGSHLSGEYAKPDAKATVLEPKKGDVVIFDGRLWHGTTKNSSGNSRWVITSSYSRWWMKQIHDIPSSLPKSIFDELNQKEKALLGYCSIPPSDESVSNNIKQGYSSIEYKF